MPNRLAKAAQAAGLLEQFQQAQQNNLRQGQYGSSRSIGPGPSQTQGFTTGQQAYIQGAHSALGPLGSSLAMLTMPYAQRVASGAGLDLSQPIQVGYGGSTVGAQEQAQVAGQVQAAQLANMGESGQRLIKALAGQLPQIGVPQSVAQGLASAAEGSPQTAGMILQQLSMQFPQVQTLMSQLDPSYIADLSPIVSATYFQNNGEFDPQAFARNLQQFQQQYQSGAYGNVAAQVAAHAVAYASEQGVPPQAVPAAARNVARAAHEFVERGLAPNFGAALQLATATDQDVLRDPSRAMSQARYFDNLARRGFIDRQQIFQASQLAAEQGLDPASTMQAVALSGRVGRALGDRAGNLAAGASDALAGFQQSHRAQVLGAVHQGHPKGRALIEQALAQGDEQALDQIYDRAKASPEIARLVQAGGPQLGAHFASQVSQTNPSLYGRVVRTEVMDAAEGNPELKRVLSNRAELIRRLRTKDFTGLRPETQRALMGQGGRLAATALATIRPEHEGLPDLSDRQVKARRLGLAYPTARTKPGARPGRLARMATGRPAQPEPPELAEPAAPGPSPRPKPLARGPYSE